MPNPYRNMMSECDGGCMSKNTPQNDDSERKIIEPVSKGSPEYNMSHPGGRGYAFILNHTVFPKSSGLPNREHSENDVARMKDTFRALGFKEEEIIILDNLTRSKIYKLVDTKLHNKRIYDFEDKDCLCIAVLSHGVDGQFWALDQPFDISALWESLTSDPVPELVGKPKLYFIDCSKGKDTDEGIMMIPKTGTVTKNDRTDSITSLVKTYRLPTTADFFFAYSTSKGHQAYNILAGSPFIEELNYVIRLNQEKVDDDKDDFLSMMVTVTRRVATLFSDPLEEKKQCPTCTSTLIRKIYFRDTGDIQDDLVNDDSE